MDSTFKWKISEVLVVCITSMYPVVTSAECRHQLGFTFWAHHLEESAICHAWWVYNWTCSGRCWTAKNTTRHQCDVFFVVSAPSWLKLGIIDSNRFGTRIHLNRFSTANQMESTPPPSSIFLAIYKAGASSACLLVTKLALIVLCYKFKHFTNIFLLNNYVTF